MTSYWRLKTLAIFGFAFACKGHATCAFVGDSIAHAAGVYAPHCLQAAWPGLNTKRWLKRFGQTPIQANMVVISMGTNEHRDPALQELKTLRAHIQASRVMWIAPGPQYPSRNSVFAVAGMFGDLVFERPVEDLARDGIHFTKTGSRRIAALVSINQ
jgi:hypothetical protein